MPEAVIVNPFMHPDVIVHLHDEQEIVEERVTVGEDHEMRLGAGAYTAGALKEHGWDVEIVDAIGDDIFGNYTYDLSVSSGFGMKQVVRYEGRHMFVLSVADQKSRGGTMISSCPPDWQRSAAEIESSIIAAPSAEVYYIWSWFWSYANPNLKSLLAEEVVRSMRSKAKIIALDPNWKPEGTPPENEVASLVTALPAFDILKLNRRDAAVIVGDQNPEATVKDLRDLGASLVVLTLGDEGCVVSGDGLENVAFVPPSALMPQNTTGAGDVFGGAFVADFYAHRDPVRAAAHASEHVGHFLQQGSPKTFRQN